MIIKNFEQLMTIALKNGRRRIAVAGADDETLMEGLVAAARKGLATPVLFGDQRAIETAIAAKGYPAGAEIIHVADDDKGIAQAAVEYVRRGNAQLLMKGHMHTSTLFKAVLDKEKGLGREGFLSHIAFVQIPGYHKLFATTDGGLNLRPDFAQKVAIVQNVIQTLFTLGYVLPKVGLLSYVETVQSGDQETEDWNRICRMAADGAFGNALVDGPLAMDLCLSSRARDAKRCQSAVAGDVDAIVAPDITAGNASTKALLITGGTAAGIVAGASVPIVALSRSDTPLMKCCSIALASAMLKTPN